MAGLTLSAAERLEALERRTHDLAFELDVAQIRREALEREVAELKAREITVADLPLAELIRKLEMLGQLDASLALQPGSITPELLSERLTLQPATSTPA